MAEVLHLEGDCLLIKGATKVSSSTSTQAIVECGEKTYYISGNEMEVKKLNLEEGEVVFFGKFSIIKIGQSQGKKQPFLKRIFK